MVDEEFGRFVVVFVFQFHRFGHIVEVVAVGHQVHVGPSCLDGTVELHVAFHVVVAVEHEFLLVAYLHVFQVEGFGMPVLGTHTSVECFGGRTSCIFNCIESLLNEWVDVVLIYLPVVTNTHVDHKQGTCPEVFGQLQALMIAQPVGHSVSPVAVEVSRSFLDRSYRLLPFEAVGASVGIRTLDVASARESHESWMQVGQHLCQVGTASVGSVLECRWKEAYDVKIYDSCLRTSQCKISMSVIARGCNGCGDFLPFLCGRYFNSGMSYATAAVVDQFGSDGGVVVGVGTYPKREAVGATFHDVHAPVALVAHTSVERFDVYL